MHMNKIIINNKNSLDTTNFTKFYLVALVAFLDDHVGHCKRLKAFLSLDSLARLLCHALVL